MKHASRQQPRLTATQMAARIASEKMANEADELIADRRRYSDHTFAAQRKRRLDEIAELAVQEATERSQPTRSEKRRSALVQTTKRLGALAVLTLALGAAYVAGGFHAKHNTANTLPGAYAFTTSDLDKSYGGAANRRIQIDPNNSQNQFYFAANGAAGGKDAINLYVSTNGGKTWAQAENPAADGVNNNTDTVITGASFAKNRDLGTAFGPGYDFEVQLYSAQSQETTVALDIATETGITPIDAQSAYGVTAPDNSGTWITDPQGDNEFMLPLTGPNDVQLKPIVVDVPHSGK